jgi:signal transduction histidine kinase
LLRTLQEKYPAVQFTQKIDPHATLFTHQWFLERIVSNILDNAGKFTPAWWTVALVADMHGIQITDTWSGISPEQLTRIREPFWQGDAARGTEGFWLGLALVQQLVTLLGWDIIVKSTLGKWTSVVVKR